MKHAKIASNFIRIPERVDWHNEALYYVRLKRDFAVKRNEDFEKLREIASQIKDYVLDNIRIYIEKFYKNAQKNGFIVHFAKNAQQHNEIIYQILKTKNINTIVKSKSMLTEECGLNSYLEEKGIEIIDTDLGERIIQLRKEPPSHIVLPAIHLKRKEVAETFSKYLSSDPDNSNPEYLTSVARKHLRKKFLEAQASITGVNFAIAETGGFVVCTNEGNADLGTSLTPVHIASMGVEKLIPEFKDLFIFLRLLAPSATGQAITSYTTIYQKPMLNQELHIIIVDNHRSEKLKSPRYKNSLKCIRCGACLNTCPVYRRSGGHSYRYTIPGPIGSILGPLFNKSEYYDLPFASTLCGSCSNVCPVKVNIHEQLLYLRSDLHKYKDYAPQFLFSLAYKFLSNSIYYNLFIKFIKFLYKIPLIKFFLKQHNRKLPELPKKTFREYYKENFHV